MKRPLISLILLFLSIIAQARIVWAVPIIIQFSGKVTSASYDPPPYVGNQIPILDIGNSFTGIIRYDIDKLISHGNGTYEMESLFEFKFDKFTIKPTYGWGCLYWSIINDMSYLSYVSPMASPGEIDLSFNLWSRKENQFINNLDPVSGLPITIDPNYFSGADIFFDDAWYAQYYCSIDSIKNSPVPEPSTYFLLGSGLISLAVYYRKRRPLR